MTYTSIGDLAQSFQTRRQTFQVKSELQRLGQELSSGRKSNIATKATGDFSPIVGLERAINSIKAFETPLAETTLLARSMQNALATVQAHSDDLSSGLLAAGNAQNPVMIDAATADGETRFEAVISLFNTRVADRYAFSGTATDRPALADPATILADLTAAVAGQNTAIGVEAAIDTWFDTAGGGYETIAYVGSATALENLRIGENDAVNLGITAADSEVRASIKGFAVAALISQGALTVDLSERAALTQRAGEMILTAQLDVSAVRARIGSAEARMDEVKVASQTEMYTLEMARLDIVSADPYQTATQLEAVRAQLDTVFTVTARLSRLSLTEYLR